MPRSGIVRRLEPNVLGGALAAGGGADSEIFLLSDSAYLSMAYLSICSLLMLHPRLSFYTFRFFQTCFVTSPRHLVLEAANLAGTGKSNFGPATNVALQSCRLGNLTGSNSYRPLLPRTD